jgi:DNA-binding transcriptional MocR family regulator
MKITIDRNSSTPIYKQIRDQIRELILSGVLQPGFQLPPERKLAVKLGVNRSTVLNAYRDLRADALISSHIGQGTTVVPPLSILPGNHLENVNQLPWRQFLSGSAIRMQQPLISNILKIANRSGIISFAAGFSGHSSDPIDELLETQNRLLKDYGSVLLQYSATEGHYPLRESLSHLMEERGISVSPQEIMVLSGSQQGIDLAVRILIDPGDIILVEEPSFFGALQVFQSAGARIIGVPVDQDGMRVDLLEPLLERYRPKLIYTIPTFQNPSGAVMALERRKKLLQLAYQYQIPVLEDDPYGELRYEGAHLPPLKALDPYGYVIYLSTFSKIIFPGLRVGWVCAPEPVIRQYSLAKQMTDLHTNSLAQWIMDDFLRRGVFARRVAVIKKENHTCRDMMAEALTQYGEKSLEWYTPEGGLYFWCRLPQQLDLSNLVAKAAENKVVFVPGNIFYHGNSGQNHIRLSFSSTAFEKIKPGIKALNQAIKEVLGEREQADMSPGMEIRPIL